MSRLSYMKIKELKAMVWGHKLQLGSDADGLMQIENCAVSLQNILGYCIQKSKPVISNQTEDVVSGQQF